DDVVYCPDDASETTTSIGGEPILDGRYQLEKRLGQGGMGVVYKARHIFLKTSHAIKIILPDQVGNDPNLVTRFRQEALAAAAIRHQNIIAVTDFGVVRGTMPFLVMEFVQGESLQDIMAEEGAMSPVRAFELMQPICAGIAAAHRQGIVHRDLKPLNVMIQADLPTNEAVKILDFGLAKIKSGELLGSFIAAQTTGLMGSPFYMAPEQWSDEPPDTRADVYSLGVMLFQLLSGEVPFKGSSIPSIMKKHLTAEVPTFASKGVDVPPQIEKVVRHALEKEANDRTRSADEFARELREAMSIASAQLKRTGDSSPQLDPSKTIVGPPLPSETVGIKGVTTAVDPHAGTISSAALAEDERKTLFAQRELAQEAAAKKKFAEEQEQKRQEEEASKHKERKQLEEIVAAQTKVLEEKLSQLASSMPKGIGVVDAEATQIQRAGMTTGGDVSFPGTSAHPFPRLDVRVAPKRRLALPIVLGMLLVLLAGGGVGGYFLLKSRTNKPLVGPVKPTDPADIPIKPDLIEMPAGKFQMGRNDSLPTEAPAHEVTLNAFQMDKNEVTNAEYGQFIRQTNHAPPEQWGSIKPPIGQESLPVNNVSYDDAVAFAEWRSKRDGVKYRLPTEEEWEYAARNGDKDNLYPWGNTWQAGRAATLESGVGREQPVGTYPLGADRWGVQDLMGNVWEWTSSKASVYQGNQLQLPAQYKDWIVVRGGSYSSQSNKISATMRDWFAPNYKNQVLGFRLVKVSS
ncbi:MAG TPA: bifunctional serine/threonine-protein kinase/formylglycine-generating enzyme family protein, partial [Pyrinomonadaceae bacterium]|nr:bifunctional serine/threonine-protein kinase/formylglycine-generating enzyme family protein [Pyrinomonadaceae bacterium]